MMPWKVTRVRQGHIEDHYDCNQLGGAEVQKYAADDIWWRVPGMEPGVYHEAFTVGAARRACQTAMTQVIQYLTCSFSQAGSIPARWPRSGEGTWFESTTALWR